MGYKSNVHCDKMNRAGKSVWIYLCLEMDPAKKTNVCIA